MTFRRRDAALTVSLIFFGLFIGFVIVEISLRVIGFTYPAWEIRDPEVGFIGLPNATGMWTTEGPGGLVRFNNLGFRDIDRTIEKVPGHYRIAVLGDSFIQAREVSPDQTFTQLTERRVNECRQDKYQNVEVMNFGVGGYNTAAELQLLRHRVLAYKPDAVMLAFFVGNDIHRNHPEMDYFRTTSGIGIPLFKLEDGNVKLDMSFRDDPVFQTKMNSFFHRVMLSLINKSITFQFLNYTRHNFKGWIARGGIRHGGNRAEDNEYKEADPTGSNAKWINQQIWIGNNLSMYPPSDRLWTEAWQMTEYGIREMAKEVANIKARFSILLIAHPPQVHTDAEVLNDYPQQRLKTLASEIDAEVIDLLPEFHSRYLENRQFLYGFSAKQAGDGHWNPKGHALAAETASREICRWLQE